MIVNIIVVKVFYRREANLVKRFPEQEGPVTTGGYGETTGTKRKVETDDGHVTSDFVDLTKLPPLKQINPIDLTSPGDPPVATAAPYLNPAKRVKVESLTEEELRAREQIVRDFGWD